MCGMAGGTLRQYWAELRRRHVPRVAAYYLAGAWIAAQAASLLLDAFDLGHYTRYVIVALGAAFPVAMVLAWRFDITPRGIERTPDQAVPAVPPPQDPAPEHSIAVLPLANLSDDPANEYFSDGLSEEIRNQLARVPGLQVAARRSSFAFKASDVDVREIGRRLNVSTLLEGGVRKHADTVRIDVQLVSTRDGFHLWSQGFERRLEDVFRLQTEVAAAVLDAVRARHGLEECALPAPEERRFEVYNAYLLGRHHFHRRSEQSLLKAAQCFEQAIALDPDYALAYSGLADTYVLLGARYYGTASTAETVARAEPCARKALEITPALAEAHASMGLVQLNRGEAALAASSLARALELNPGYTMAHVWYGLALTAQGRYRDAAASNRDAFRLDPLSPIVNTNVGFDALRFGDFAEAEARFRTAIEVDQGFAVPYSGLSKIAMDSGDIGAATRWIDSAIERAPTRAFYRSRKALLSLQAGDLDGAAAQADEANRLAPGEVFDCDFQLALHMARADRDAVARIASGGCGPDYSSDAVAQARIALGELDAAREIYERHPPDIDRLIHEILNDDWTWRLPHAVNYAHLLLSIDADRGRARLNSVLAACDRVLADGIVSGNLTYLAATALAVLGHQEQAQGRLAEARRLGWSHEWWRRVDWNARELD